MDFYYFLSKKINVYARDVGQKSAITGKDIASSVQETYEGRKELHILGHQDAVLKTTYQFS